MKKIKVTTLLFFLIAFYLACLIPLARYKAMFGALLEISGFVIFFFIGMWSLIRDFHSEGPVQTSMYMELTSAGLISTNLVLIGLLAFSFIFVSPSIDFVHQYNVIRAHQNTPPSSRDFYDLRREIPLQFDLIESINIGKTGSESMQSLKTESNVFYLLDFFVLGLFSFWFLVRKASASATFVIGSLVIVLLIGVISYSAFQNVILAMLSRPY